MPFPFPSIEERATTRKALTADERERRIVEYLSTLNQGRLGEFKLARMNRISNFRKRLKELLDEIIELRAEDLAAGMLMEYAEPRPEKRADEVAPAPPKKVEMPVWIRKSGTGE